MTHVLGQGIKQDANIEPSGRLRSNTQIMKHVELDTPARVWTLRAQLPLLAPYAHVPMAQPQAPPLQLPSLPLTPAHVHKEGAHSTATHCGESFLARVNI